MAAWELCEGEPAWYKFFALGVRPCPAGACGGVAQLVEQRTHKPRVGGSIPSTATNSLLLGAEQFVLRVAHALLPHYRTHFPSWSLTQSLPAWASIFAFV